MYIPELVMSKKGSPFSHYGKRWATINNASTAKLKWLSHNSVMYISNFYGDFMFHFQKS